MTARPATICIADLVGSKIVTAEGKLIGRVIELRVTPGPEYRIIAIECGLGGWLHRLHVLRRVAMLLPRQDEPRVISWKDVARYERYVVTLKPGREPS